MGAAVQVQEDVTEEITLGLSVEDEIGLERVEEMFCTRYDDSTCIFKTESEAAVLPVFWSPGIPGRWSQGRVLEKGDQAEQGGLESLPREGVLTWALPGGFRMSTGGIDNVIILPKGHFLQTPLSTSYNHSATWYSLQPPLTGKKRGFRQLLKVENGRVRIQIQFSPVPNPLFPPPSLD